MKLYHGSNTSIDEIDLKRGRRGKDFGQGFYLSPDRQQAQQMAERTVDREEAGTPTVTTYLFDESILLKPSDLKVKIFEGYSQEWAEFIMMNRRNKTHIQAHDYDIVYLIKQLSFIRPTFQYFFGTERAIQLLQKDLER